MDPKNVRMAILGGALNKIDLDSHLTSANPVFRRAVLHFVVWDELDTDDLTEESRDEVFLNIHLKMNLLRQITPDGGAYINDSDYFEPNWE